MNFVSSIIESYTYNEQKQFQTLLKHKLIIFRLTPKYKKKINK